MINQLSSQCHILIFLLYFKDLLRVVVLLSCSFCKGRTLHSFVRDPKISLDINKTRQIAQEIIKVRCVTEIASWAAGSLRCVLTCN